MKRLLMLAVVLISAFAGTALADNVSLVKRTGTVSHCREIIQLTFDRETVVIHPAGCAVRRGRRLATGVDGAQLYLLRDRRPVAERLGYRALYRHSGWQLAVVTDAALLLANRDVRLEPVRESRTVLLAAPEKRREVDPVVQDFLAQLGLDASEPTFNNPCFVCGNPDGFNVVGVKVGTVRPDEYYLVGGHYDSTSPNNCNQAPGSNDNGSGTAAVMELARAFAAVDTEASIIFVAFGGEELGLLGGSALARGLADIGVLDQIKGFVVLDMISFYKDNYAAYLEGSNGNQAQINTLKQIGQITRDYTELAVTGSYDYWGSDHQPFLDRGVPGALMIEQDWDSYASYHTTNDTIGKQKLKYGLEMTQAAGAVLATWAVIVPAADDDTIDDDADDDLDDDSVDDDLDDDADDDDVQDDDVGDDDASGDDDDDSSCGC